MYLNVESAKVQLQISRWLTITLDVFKWQS